MHRISHVHVENFRSCALVEAEIADFTPLVGYNNAGKSNFMAAAHWVVRASSLQATDFYDAKKPVIVTATISDITNELLERLDPTHKKKIAPFCLEGTLTLRRVQPEPGASAKKITLEVLAPGSDWKPNPGGIDASIKHLLPDPIEIGAMENATEDVSKSKTTTTIGKLIAEVIRPIEEQHGASLEKALEGIRRRLEADGADRAPELVAMDQGTNACLSELFPGLQVKVHVPPPEVREIFKSGTLKVYEEGTAIPRDPEALGHGAQRSIQMALIRYLADLKRGTDVEAARTLLLIDEPDLYLHPHGIEQVRLALKSLAEREYQVIFATHSPLMINSEDVATTVILSKDENQCTACRPRLADAVTSVIADSPSQAEALFEFSNLSEVLFSDSVLLSEGSTEKRLLPVIFEVLAGKSFRAARIGFVPVGGGGNIIRSLGILKAMSLDARAVVDLDFAFRDAVRGGLLEGNHPAVVSAKRICGENSRSLSFDVADDGFPRQSKDVTAAQAFALLAKRSDFAELVSDIHAILREQHVWLWARGAIEQHLGLSGKSISEHNRFAQALRSGPPEDVIEDHRGVADLVSWISQAREQP